MKVGDRVLIIAMKDEPAYAGRCGIVTKIDDIGNVHGTWGGLAIIPEEDCVKVLKKGDRDYDRCNYKTRL